MSQSNSSPSDDASALTDTLSETVEPPQDAPTGLAHTDCSSAAAGDGRDHANRGVSEIIGFTLLFALVLGAAVIAAFIGVDALGTVNEESNTQVGVNNFDTLRSNINELSQGAPYRVAELTPQDATFRYGSTYKITVTASGGGVDLTGSNAIEMTGTELVQETGERSNITYASGLIATAQEDGVRALVASPPVFRVSDNQAVFTVPITYQQSRTPSYISATDATRFPVLSDRTGQEVVQRVATDGSGNLTTMTGSITIEDSSVPGAWKAYFDENEQFSPTDLDGDGNTEYAVDSDGDGTAEKVGGQFTTSRLYLQRLDIAIGYDTQI